MTRARRGSLTLLAAGLLCACSHAPKPPPSLRPVQWKQGNLANDASGVIGNVSHVANGLWCAGDGAFSLPVAPFPEGPTEIYGDYFDHGVTSTLKMLDANESVLEVVRTKIRADLPADEVLPEVSDKLERGRQFVPSLRFSWIQQRGRTQIESVNPSESYEGRKDIVYLALSRGTNYDPKGACRVDRHFVDQGYYFELIAVANRPAQPKVPTPARDACAFALELAAWAAEHICVGAACCPKGGQAGPSPAAR